MIEIDSFIMLNNEFVPINEFKSKLYRYPYIEGGMSFRVNGVEIIRRSMGDLIDQLWAYIVMGVAKVSKGEVYKTYFPDQPIELEFVPINSNKVKISVRSIDTNVAVADINELKKAVKENGMCFFGILVNLDQRAKDDYKNLIDLLKSF